MGRPPSNGAPSFRFIPTEVAEMEAILQANNNQLPAREVLVSLSEKFNNSTERLGNGVQMKQVWNWFQNRRFALRAKAGKAPRNSSLSMTHNDSVTARSPPQLISSSTDSSDSDNSQMEFEARSVKDGAWYDVASFLSHRSLGAGDLEVLVCFADLGPEDEWVNVRRNVRQRSVPCVSSECVTILPGDLVLCFQENKEQDLYFDARVLNVERQRHDARGCRCRFLVRYDHDQCEEHVQIRKICRRPETDYRLQHIHAKSATRTDAGIQTGNTIRVYPPVETAAQKQIKVPPAETAAQKQIKVAITTVSQINN